MTTESLPVLAILGGTGDLGTGLARRWAQAGYRVIIGSRTLEKAEAAVADLREVMAERGVAEVSVEAMENLAAAEAAEIVTLTVPFSHQASTLEYVKPALQGKILLPFSLLPFPSLLLSLIFLPLPASLSLSPSLPFSSLPLSPLPSLPFPATHYPKSSTFSV